MANIELVLDLLDWNNSPEKQAEGLSLGKAVADFRVFIQPCNERHNKNVWDNCAIILSKKTDRELCPYFVELLEWLQDMNWPGAETIYKRLLRVSAQMIEMPYRMCLAAAKQAEDTVWTEVLLAFYKDLTAAK